MTPHRTTQAAPQPEEGRVAGRIPALDGLRAASILLVLAAHLLPLGPAVLQLNSTAGLSGMAIFFSLSGFLIVRFPLAGFQFAYSSSAGLRELCPWPGQRCLPCG